MKKITTIIALTVSSLSLASGAPTSELRADCQPGSKVTFEAIGKPSLLRIEGKGNAPKCALKVIKEKVTGEFEFDLESLDTGITLRNSHMKEKYLKTKEFPKAKLVLTEMSAMPPGSSKKGQSFSGTLELKGVKKPIQGTFDMDVSKDSAGGVAQFEILLQDFGVDIPSFAGITVSEKVKVKVDLALKKIN